MRLGYVAAYIDIGQRVIVNLHRGLDEDMPSRRDRLRAQLSNQRGIGSLASTVDLICC